METQVAAVAGNWAVDEGVRQIVASFKGRKGILIPCFSHPASLGYLPADVWNMSHRSCWFPGGNLWCVYVLCPVII
jgi:hypothetical protein